MQYRQKKVGEKNWWSWEWNSWFSGLVEKTVYQAKISDIVGKYFIASGYNKFTSAILNAKIKQNELANKSYIYNLVKNFNLDTKIATLAIRLAIESVVFGNWISEFKFCTHTKINTVAFYSFYAEKIFTSFVWLIPVSRVCTHLSLFDNDILQHILSDLKFSTRSVLVDISNYLKKKNVLLWKLLRK